MKSIKLKRCLIPRKKGLYNEANVIPTPIHSCALSFSLLISGILAFGLSLLSESYYPLNDKDLLVLGFGLMFLFASIAFYTNVQRPLQRIIHEMKALLTGKNLSKNFND